MPAEPCDPRALRHCSQPSRCFPRRLPLHQNREPGGSLIGIAGSGEKDANAQREELARAYVERLEEALTAATHERDAAAERARLAGAGVEQLERLVEGLRSDLEREVAEAEKAGREAAARVEKQLENAKAGIESRDRRLEVAAAKLEAREEELERARADLGEAGEELVARDRELEAASTLLEAQGAELAKARERADEAAREREQAAARLEVAGEQAEARRAELERLRAAARDRERSLALAEARLEKARQRAEYFEGSLVELREGKAYRLMRVLWRLRRPFRRASKRSAPGEDASPPAEEPEPAPARPLRVASVLDEMSEACLGPECELVPLRLEGWAEQLDQRRPDLLLVESAWNGNGGEWQHRIAKYPRKDLAGLPALRALLDGCRERGIPTAFWNKEDPVHFERFAEAAALFDHVFTTDARCVERYRALPGGARTVTPLPFAAQPRIHNPAAVVPERSSSPCFAGAWYRDRHADRRRALAALLDAARPRGLVIYDRSFGGKDGAFGFPERFAPHVLGGLPYERILDVYRSHRVFLNANSVADSPTMCSRRVFELAACDTAILSTPGEALGALLGDGTIDEAADEASAAAALERLLGDEPERRRRARAARRRVFAEHTYAARLATIAETAGLDAYSLRREPFARPGEAMQGAPAGDGDARPWQLHLQPGAALSEPALADLAAAASFAEADVIGAHPGNGAAPLEHRQVDDLDPRALLLSRDLLAQRGAPAGSSEQIRAQLRQWSAEGVRLYAADADLLAA